jgi:hypothetical protein
VRIAPLERLLDDDWDLTMLRVVPFVNGVYHTKRIASEARVHIDLVMRALSILLCVRVAVMRARTRVTAVLRCSHYRLITMIDIFQYSNVYTVTSEIARLYTSEFGALL